MYIFSVKYSITFSQVIITGEREYISNGMFNKLIRAFLSMFDTEKPKML